MENSDMKYPSKVYKSFAFNYFLRSFLFTIFAARVFAFYEYEVRLDITLILIGYLIYGSWNMINDPILGFLSDKPNRFWNKYGRRFPWIIGAGIPYCFFIIFVFAPPVDDAAAHSMFLFAWFLTSICLYDAFFSAWMTNSDALFPDKFRSDKERRKIAGIGAPIGLISTALGTLLPPLFITYGNRQSYMIAMIIMSLISFGIFIITIPGNKEDKEMIENAIRYTKEKEKQDSFIKAMKVAGKHKNFVAYLIAYLAFHCLITIVMASIPYVVPFILGLPATAEIYFSVSLLIGQLLGIIAWVKLTNKLGHRNLFIIGLIWAVITLGILFFFIDLWTAVIIIGIIGFGVGSIYYGNQLILTDCIDEIVIDTRKRQEGVFAGIRTFMVRLSIIVQAFTFWAIHIITGFDSSTKEQSDLALLGLRIQFSLLSMVIMLIGLIIFWWLYDLTPEKIAANKAKIKELGL